MTTSKKDEDEMLKIRIPSPLNPFSAFLDLRDMLLGRPFIVMTPPIVPIYPLSGTGYGVISKALRFFKKPNTPQP